MRLRLLVVWNLNDGRIKRKGSASATSDSPSTYPKIRRFLHAHSQLDAMRHGTRETALDSGASRRVRAGHQEPASGWL